MSTARFDQVFNKDSYVPYEKPKDVGKWEAFHLFLWNGEKHTVLGRTAKSWAQLTIFYLCFYAGLGALSAICYETLLYTLSDKHPTYLLADSLIGTNPGLGFRPISETVDIDGSLIWYNAANATQSNAWVQRIDSFLEPYSRVEGGGLNQVVCDYDRPPAPGKVCVVDVKHWAPCNSEHGYSYNKSSPCIFVKLNKIYGWEPTYYKQPSEYPKAMPDDVKEQIANSDNNTVNTVWISCHGETPMDREHIGPIEYYPKQGLAGYYFPYVNTPGYLSPLVAVRFARPKVNVLINIECRAWAKNIIYSNSHGVREGSVHFEILID